LLITQEYREYLDEPASMTIEEAMLQAEQIVKNRIERELDLVANILDIEISYTDAGDRLIVNAIITTIERIDEQRGIINFTPEEGGRMDGETANAGT